MDSDLIIGYDGSAAGRDALAFGRRLALATGARATVVHAIAYPAFAQDLRATGEDGLWARAADRALAEARDVLADVPGVTFEAVVERSPARALHRAAEGARAGLLVVGSTHRGGVGRIAPGTTADQILQAAACAVAVAPAGYADRAANRPLRLVGAAVDGGPDGERLAGLAGRIARSAGAALRLVTVVEPHAALGPLYSSGYGYDGYLDAVREAADGVLARAALAAGDDLRVELRRGEGPAADELVAQSEDLDLLVVGSRGLGPLRRIVPGSVSAKVLRDAACPVLVLPRRAGEDLDDPVGRLAAAAAQ